MQKLIFKSFFLIALALTASAHAAGKTMDILAFRDLLPGGDFRKTSGDETLCPSGDLTWIENGKTLKFGGAQPALFHSFNEKKSEDMSSKTDKCTATTTNTITDVSRSGNSGATVEQHVSSDCAGAKNSTKYVMKVLKMKQKSTIHLKIQIVHADKKLKNVNTSCSYEQTPETK